MGTEWERVLTVLPHPPSTTREETMFQAFGWTVWTFLPFEKHHALLSTIVARTRAPLCWRRQHTGTRGTLCPTPGPVTGPEMKFRRCAKLGTPSARSRRRLSTRALSRLNNSRKSTPK
uniref:Uncharacterized protein n=1 Tax=Cacopsylla melanoneura TaxID=428564 RepID=A0A8D8XGY1_9HEMI